MTTDQRVDNYIASAAPFAQPILEHLRALVHATVPNVEETIKWGMPHFTYKGKNVAGLAAFKAHASFGIHGEARAPEGLGQFGKLGSLADLPPDEELAQSLLGAVARIDDQGTAIRRRIATKPRKPEIPVPDDLKAALTAAARDFFDGLSPSCQREYLEWIVEAKRPETRTKRIAQTAEWLGEGKKRYWKYDRC
jgi:uncharacterized protein YdeI (YjbR/CyaY-like superfamily)